MSTDVIIDVLTEEESIRIDFSGDVTSGGLRVYTRLVATIETGFIVEDSLTSTNVTEDDFKGI